ncbi:hypothetical protein MMC10_007340 [Thelotrema lepadinum]|nr:hypothetical protein [Thelotrema lepadinum]
MSYLSNYYPKPSGYNLDSPNLHDDGGLDLRLNFNDGVAGFGSSELDVGSNELVMADATISKDSTDGTAVQDLALFRALGAKLGVSLCLPKHVEAEDSLPSQSVSPGLSAVPDQYATLLPKTLVLTVAQRPAFVPLLGQQ